jgi:hypothetical protein
MSVTVIEPISSESLGICNECGTRAQKVRISWWYFKECGCSANKQLKQRPDNAQDESGDDVLE